MKYVYLYMYIFVYYNNICYNDICYLGSLASIIFMLLESASIRACCRRPTINSVGSNKRTCSESSRGLASCSNTGRTIRTSLARAGGRAKTQVFKWRMFEHPEHVRTSQHEQDIVISIIISIGVYINTMRPATDPKQKMLL